MLRSDAELHERVELAGVQAEALRGRFVQTLGVFGDLVHPIDHALGLRVDAREKRQRRFEEPIDGIRRRCHAAVLSFTSNVLTSNFTSSIFTSSEMVDHRKGG